MACIMGSTQDHSGHSGGRTQPWKIWEQKSQKEGPHKTVFLVSGAEYRGEWSGNQRHGKGTLTYKNGDQYEGDWACGLRHGQGTLWVLTSGRYLMRYSGEWREDAPWGLGTYHSSEQEAGFQYVGGFERGLRHGRGRASYALPGGGSDVYEGDWACNVRHGRGTLMLANGDVYEGSWERDMKHGPGTHFYTAKGKRYDGVWQDGVAKCGSYSDVHPPAPGAAGNLPNLELADPAGVLHDAAEDA